MLLFSAIPNLSRLRFVCDTGFISQIPCKSIPATPGLFSPFWVRGYRTGLEHRDGSKSKAIGVPEVKRNPGKVE